MATDYQPKIEDRQMKIRKTVTLIRKKTRLDKAVIAERLMLFGVENIGQVFPDIEKDLNNIKQKLKQDSQLK